MLVALSSLGPSDYVIFLVYLSTACRLRHVHYFIQRRNLESYSWSAMDGSSHSFWEEIHKSYFPKSPLMKTTDPSRCGLHPDCIQLTDPEEQK